VYEFFIMNSMLTASDAIRKLDAITKLPRVSLAIPVYNGQRFLAAAIQSILAQDYKDFELIITDNASTDGTEQICRSFAQADVRVRYYRNERNLGAGPNHNLGFELSRGEFFKWCADDDCLSPNFLGSCVAVLDANKDVVLAYGKTQSIDENGAEIPLVGEMMIEHGASDGPLARFRADFTGRRTNFEIFGLFRSSALRKTTLQRSYYGSDKTLVHELTLLGKFAYIPTITFFNREHPNRSINIKVKKVLANWQDTSISSRSDLTNWRHLLHLTEIAVRHRDIVSPVKALGVVFLWALRPSHLARLAAEVVGLASPSTHLWLLRAGRRLADILDRSKSPGSTLRRENGKN
jgi:glycosyltransferase involved in cell wall biosynthesis